MRRKVSEVQSALGSIIPIVPPLFLVSCLVNVLALTGSFYMLQVYDRVLASRSIPTLIALSALAMGLYVFQAALEIVRGQIFVRLASRVDRSLSLKAHAAAMRLPLYGGTRAESVQPLRDVDTVRNFLAGPGPAAIFDVPWIPLYLGFVFLLHPMLGVITAAGAAVMLIMTLITERMIRKPSSANASTTAERYGMIQACERNAEVIRAMGLGPNLTRRFTAVNQRNIGTQERLGDIGSTMSVTSKTFRMLLQSALLGAGAYFTIQGQMSAGAIIAVSIAASRALAPIEVAISNWKALVAARQCSERLDKVFQGLPKDSEPLELPPPKASLVVENISVALPGPGSRQVLHQVSFEVKAGQAVAIIGPSAAGKSSLGRSLVGIWPVAKGAVRLDGAALERWAPDVLGAHIGYMPQEIELLEGTLAENISRFAPSPDPAAILAAARAADVHEMILRLPQGYETRIADRGTTLSAGQRQRIGLARALYGDPFLVVLDEPNSNLDADGDAALIGAIKSVAARGGISIIIAHRPAVLQAVDLVGVIGNGQLTAFGPRDEIIRRATRPAPLPASATAN